MQKGLAFYAKPTERKTVNPHCEPPYEKVNPPFSSR